MAFEYMNYYHFNGHGVGYELINATEKEKEEWSEKIKKQF